jgi:hypothetical protein
MIVNMQGEDDFEAKYLLINLCKWPKKARK